MYTIKGKKLAIAADEKKLTFEIILQNGDVWTMSRRPYVELTDGTL